MSNDYYTASSAPGQGSGLSSPTIRAEYALIQAAFDKMPGLAGNNNLPVFVNAGATAISAVSAATARTNLGLGSAAVISVPVTAANGGTGLTTLTAHAVQIGNGTGTMTQLATGSAGQALLSGGAGGDPTWTTSTYPTSAGVSGQVPRSDGTNFVAGKLAAADLSNGVSGSGAVALVSSPAFTTPNIGVATATTVNGMTITSTTGALTISNGKTLSASNTITVAGNDGSTLNVGAGGTLAGSAYTDTTNASNISSGTLASARGGAGTITGALKGNGSGVVSQAAAADLSNGTSGSGAVVLVTGATLVTPTLGAATATSINGLGITSSTGTLTISNGKTLAASNTITLAGTDGSTLNIGTGGTLSTIATSGAITDATGTLLVTHGGTGVATLTNHGVLLGQSTSAVVATAAGSSGQVLRSGGAAGDPAWSTATFPATAGSAANVLRSDGTNFLSAALAAADLSNGVTGSGAVALASAPALTNPTVGTQTAGDNSTKAASTAYVDRGASGASMVLIQRQSVSGVAQVDFSAGIDSTYDDYVFELSDVTSSSAGSTLWMRGSTDGGSTFLSTNEYMYAYQGFGADLSTANNGGVSQAKIVTGSTLANGTGQHFGATIQLKAPSGTTRYKGVYAAASYFDNANNTYVTQTAGTIKTTSAINAIRFLASAGNLSGIFSLYGVRKS